MSNFTFYSLKVVKDSTTRYDIERKVTNPQSIYNVAVEVLKMDEEPEEVIWLLTLSTKNEITGLFEVSRGSINASIFHPREIFKRAVMQNAASIAVLHNHPSGDPSPSNEDITVTQRLKECGKIMGIELLDHVIVGDGRYISLKEKGIV